MNRGLNILLTVLISFFMQVSGVQCAHGALLLDKVVATVNDEVITWSELMTVMNLEGKKYLENVSPETRQNRIKELERPFLNNLIEMRLQVQAAGKLGLSVSDSEVDDAIADIKSKFNLSEEAFMESLRAEKMTMSDYRSRLSDQILIQKVVNTAVKAKIVISDSEIEEYYEAHRDEYSKKDQMKIRQIFFAAPDEDSQRAELEARGEQIFQRIQEGEDFEALAKEFSEDPSSEFGGDLGYISRGSAIKEIEDTADTLEINEVSMPFWSKAGLHLIKLEDRVKGGSNPKIMEKIRDRLSQERFESAYHEWMSGLREKAHIDIKL
jgi:peptidyl-prolyl cis-trans isomerase SurA